MTTDVDVAPLRLHEELLTEGWMLAESDPGAAAGLLGEAAIAALSVGDVSRALAVARDAEVVAARGDELAGAVAGLALGIALLFGERPADAEPLLARALSVLRAPGGSPPWRPLYQGAAMLYWLERYEEAGELLRMVVRRARIEREHAALPVTLDTLAAVEFRTGDWLSADAHSTEALRLARKLDDRFQIASGLTTLARLAAVQGRADECRQLVGEALSASPRTPMIINYARSASGLLELGLGNAEAAQRELQAARETSIANPQIFQWEGDHVEALTRAGRRADAKEALARFDGRARQSGRVWGLATVARCRGLVASEAEIDAAFEEALELHARAPMPFEQARTELCFGERLRRASRIRESRPHLQSALDTFDALGAAPWAAHARRELEPRRRARVASSPVERLTTHELQVVRLVRRGATNREAAAELFVSPKTIEYHLSNVYGKLVVRSRTELVLLLASLPDLL
jgi:DNA-binding NarL/FixJ family response regulator